MPKPNARGKAALLIIAAIIMVILGFVGGQLAMALQTLPGDAQDPVATQSYVEGKIGERLAALTTRIEELEAEVAALKGSGTTTDPGTTNPGTTNPGTTSSNLGTVTITGDGVNIRSGPSTDTASLGKLSKGTVVTLLSTDGNWHKIQNGNTVGYVAAYLTNRTR